MRKFAGILVQIVGGLFLLYGVLVFCIFGHVNSGNGAIIIFGGLAWSVTFFWKHLRRTRWMRIARNITAVFLLVCFAVAFVISGIMVWFGYLNMPPESVAGTVVVLGCEIQDAEPSQTLQARLDAALAYLEKHPETPVVVAGGIGDDEVYSEAYVMRKYLVEQGIEEGRIYCEERSRNTEENLIFAAEIIRDNDLPETIFVATDGFHEFRAYLHGMDNGLTVYALPVRDFTLATLSMQPEFWVREILGVLHFTFIG